MSLPHTTIATHTVPCNSIKYSLLFCSFSQVEELRASERNLRVRVKSLTNELVMYKRGRPSTRTSSRDRLPSLDRSNQQRNNSGTRQRSFSRERSAAYARQVRERSLSHDRLYAQTRRDRSSSRDRPSSAPNRSRRSESPASLRGSFNSIPRSPSPAGEWMFLLEERIELNATRLGRNYWPVADLRHLPDAESLPARGVKGGRSLLQHVLSQFVNTAATLQTNAQPSVNG